MVLSPALGDEERPGLALLRLEELLCLAAVVVHRRQRRNDLGHGVRPILAGFGVNDVGDVIHVLHHDLGELPQEGFALGVGHGTPGGKGAPRIFDGGSPPARAR